MCYYYALNQVYWKGETTEVFEAAMAKEISCLQFPYKIILAGVMRVRCVND